MPRLDHLLYYAGMDIDLAATNRCNPYFAAAPLLPRLAHRLVQGEPAVAALFADVPRPVRRLAVVRSWARFGAARVWDDAPNPPGMATLVDDFVADAAAAARPAPTAAPPLADLGGTGYWGRRSAAAARAARRRPAAPDAPRGERAVFAHAARAVD